MSKYMIILLKNIQCFNIQSKMKQNITSSSLMVLLNYYYKRRDSANFKVSLETIRVNISTIVEFNLKYPN